MVETLNDVIENSYGCIISRLYRVLRAPLLEYVGLKPSEPHYKKCCCCIPKLWIFFFVVMCGAMALVLYSVVGSEGGSIVAGLEISGTCVVGIAIIIHATTFCSVCYSLLFSPKKRVSIVATQLGLKEEGFVHALKQEVELLTEIVLALDGFKGIQTRIVLFLDGLENSEQQKVLHLVDSINLLFTDPDAPFINVIALDPRVMVRAIEQNFSSVLQDSHITALDYLKNIIHLPVFLPEPKTSFSGNIPDGLRLSVEELLRHRKTSGFELEWEGENLDLSSTFVHEPCKSNRFSKHGRHSTILTINQSQSGVSSCRLNRSYNDLHCDKHEETPDLAHVLAGNETLTPLGIQRLLHTTSLSGRLLRGKGLTFQWNALASWVSLVDAWPFRASWLVLILEEFLNVLPDNLLLKTLFTATQAWLPNSSGFEYAMDNDPMYFESYLGSHFPLLKVDDVRKFLRGTVNLDPAIRNQLSQSLQAMTNQTLNKVDDAGIGDTEGLSNSMDLAVLTEEGVCVKLSQIYGLTLTMIPYYQTIIRENHINGRVLCECDLLELKDVMEMNFGDWQLFRAWILRNRIPSGCLTWQSKQGEKGKNSSGDTYVEMGNLSCVNSAAADSRNDAANNDGAMNCDSQKSGARTTVNVASIPKIVLDPGSSVNSISDCDKVTRGEMESRSETNNGEDTSSKNNEDEKQVKVTCSRKIQDMYTITPPASFTDSSEDDERDDCTESSPLVRSEQPSFESTSSAEQSGTSSSRTLSWEARPLLSRQPEIDQGSESSRGKNLNTLNDVEPRRNISKKWDDCCSEPRNLKNLVENDDELESQRAVPILFTLSPTKKGKNQVVSVVATRELPAAFSRSSSTPSSPASRKSKSPKAPLSPKLPRSPKSSKSFRGIFGCHGGSEKDIDGDKDASNFSIKSSNENVRKKVENDEMGANTTFDCQFYSHDEPCSRKKDICESEDLLSKIDDITQLCDEKIERMKKCKATIENSSRDSLATKRDVHDTNALPAIKAIVDLHSKPLPHRVSAISHNDSLSKDRSSANDSFEESTNNSDKGYESVENTPSLENEGNTCSLNTNGTVPSNRTSELVQNGNSKERISQELKTSIILNDASCTKQSVWVPLQDSRTSPKRKKVTTNAAGQPEHSLFNQTAV